MSLTERIHREVSHLPEPLIQEVLDFIGYLEYRYGLRKDAGEDGLMAAQEDAMHHVWDNAEDEVWNDFPTW
ncbi:MAG: DUF2281 domain-containing protein [Magnetococcus sp. DMHC-1]